MELFSAEDMERLFAALSDKLESKSEKGTKFKLYIAGGCAMMLSVGIRRTTADIDVVFSENADLIHQCAIEISEETGIFRGWCNDMIMLSSSYTPAVIPYSSLYKSYGCLDVFIPHTELLLCMKLIAFRSKDIQDINFLIKQIEADRTKISVQNINDWFDKYYTSFGKKPKLKRNAVYFIKEVFE